MSEKLNFSIGVDLTELNRNLNKASGAVESFAQKNKQRFEDFGNSMNRLGQQLSVVSLAAIGLGAASIKMASDFEESINKVNVAFGVSSEQVKAFAKESLDTFGIAEGTALDMAALFGDMATSMGLPQQEAAKMSTSLVGLAGDLASFKNIGIAQATTALNGVFTGETESLKLLGIVMTEANLQQFAYTQGINESVQSMTQAEKVQLRYQYILANTTNAQGDFARTGGGAANQMRVFQERLKEVSQQLGSIILPYFTKFITYVNGLVKSFQNLSPTMQKIIVAVGALVAAAAPLAFAIGAISSALPAIISGFTLLAGPIGLIVAGVVALTIAIVKNWDTIKAWAQDVVNYFIRLYNESIIFRAGIEVLIAMFKNFWETIKFVFGSIYTVITTVWSNIYEYLKGVAKLIFAVLTFDLDGIKKGLKETIGGIRSNVSNMFDELSNKASTFFDNVTANNAKAINNVLNGEVREVNFKASEETKTQLKNDVSTAVSEGIKQGSSNVTNTPQVSGVNAGLTSAGMADVPNAQPTALTNIVTAVDTSLQSIMLLMQEFNEQASELIQGSIVNTFQSLGDAIGNAMAQGGNFVQNLGRVLLGQMGKFLSNFGALAIKYGTAALFINKTSKSLFTPAGIGAAVGLIAAGVALSAAGAAISSAAQGGMSGGSVSSGGASKSYGSSNFSSSSYAAQGNNEVVFRISGQDLLGVLRRAEGNELRLG